MDIKLLINYYAIFSAGWNQPGGTTVRLRDLEVSVLARPSPPREPDDVTRSTASLSQPRPNQWSVITLKMWATKVQQRPLWWVLHQARPPCASVRLAAPWTRCDRTCGPAVASGAHQGGESPPGEFAKLHFLVFHGLVSDRRRMQLQAL